MPSTNALLATFENEPALLTPGSESKFQAFLEKAATDVARIEAANDNPVMHDGFWFSSDDWRSVYRPYIVTQAGILLIPVKGVLLHDFGYQLGSYATGYTYITQALRRGLSDPAVKGIALMCDSPGGHVAGNFDLVDEIYAARGTKPIAAFAHESAYSAAYSIFSAADVGRTYVSRTGGVGSIGVLTSHYDYSKMLENDGLKITFIHFGKHKVDGNYTSPLPDDVKKRIQARIDELGEVFVSTVARNRGMDAAAVRATEAATFTATEATSNGLADNTGSLDDALAAFAADMSKEEDETMTTTQDKAAGTFDQAALDAARAEGFAAGKIEGNTEGKKAEKDRRDAILGSDAAKTRPVAANAVLDTNMNADEAVKFLANMPEEKTVAAVVDPKTPKGKDGAAADFKAAMDSTDQPNLGAPNEPTEAAVRQSRVRAAAGSVMTLADKK